MKNIKSMLALVFLSLILIACQNKTNSNSSANNSLKIALGEPGVSIGVRSLEELDEMREMINCKDSEKLEKYLRSVEGGGAESADDLKVFVNLIDVVPYVSLIGGEITWINRSCADNSDGKNFADVLFITEKNEHGTWTRFEYDLNSIDTSKAVQKAISDLDPEYVLKSPVQSSDKKITVYSEKIEILDDKATTTWIASIDGVLARIIYNSASDMSVGADVLFSVCSVSTVKQMCNKK